MTQAINPTPNPSWNSQPSEYDDAIEAVTKTTNDCLETLELNNPEKKRFGKGRLLAARQEMLHEINRLKLEGCSGKELEKRVNSMQENLRDMAASTHADYSEFLHKNGLIRESLQRSAQHPVHPAPSEPTPQQRVSMRDSESESKPKREPAPLEPKTWEEALGMTAGAMTGGWAGGRVEEKIVERAAEKAREQWTKSARNVFSAQAECRTAKKDLEFAKQVFEEKQYARKQLPNHGFKEERLAQHLVKKAEADLLQSTNKLKLAKQTEAAAVKTLQNARTYAASAKITGKIVGGILGAVGGNVVSAFLSSEEPH